MSKKKFPPLLFPEKWVLVKELEDGCAYLSTDQLRVIISEDVELDGKKWIHLSCSRAGVMPSYYDLRRIKETFIGRDKKAIQVLPGMAQHINIHPWCLHLFHCPDGDGLPDFTRGGDTI